MGLKNEQATSYVTQAFLQGIGFGQAMLEQSMENDFMGALQQSMAGRKFGGVHHQVALPNTFDIEKGTDGKEKIVNIRPDYENKYVRYKLRSDKWRDAMFKEKENFLKLLEEINKN